MKRIVAVAFLVLFAVAVGACSGAKEPAEQAIKAAEEALNASKAEAMKYIPDQVRGVEDSLKAAKDTFAKGDYKGAASAATAAAAKAKDLAPAAAARKAELTKGWEELNAKMPKMISDIKGRIATLSRSKKLPKGVDKSKIDRARSDLAEIGKTWDGANQSFRQGDLAVAVDKAVGAREKAAEVMATLRMKGAEKGML